ncbi:glycosyl transferase family 2 [Gillisia mitskevichiae]|uniref:Glycosyl transferase family 2 n=1 Tax=Gillisia mitskevichiae TaxID=270921 RepID=A0A495P2N4_9FLAO|nr:glycosyltransferase family 2 protein [Gillisia mitskevichiae]RKS44921.1 glycosyl transferase family 2 [Gillisia mitskevichiae]
MKIYIVIPAHNEAEFIGSTLQSLVDQTYLPAKIVVVDDQSNDNTPNIVSRFGDKYPFISLISITSTEAHLPGSKVINAFNQGMNTLDSDYDVLCKFDADLIFPQNYLETLVQIFNISQEVGMAGGFCSIQQNEKWILENLTNKDHIRGALKAYRKDCFRDIEGLRPTMGWDTVDELLAQYHGWEIKTDQSLLVKHLKPTGSTYNKASKYKQGEAFYKLRYGFIITLIASAKLAFRKKDFRLFQDYIAGYFKASEEKQTFLLTHDQGRFARKLRWKKMLEKVF